MSQNWKVGDWAIYRKQKRSESPGPRAENVHPDEHGEKYTYVVEKYWVVEQINEDGTLQLLTRRGKRHTVDVTDSRLRRPNWWERFVLSNRFRLVEETT